MSNRMSYHLPPTITSIDSSATPSSGKIEAKIEHWKRHLLDLTRRSRLLYFRSANKSTIQVLKPSPEQLFTAIVMNERTLKFPMPKKGSKASKGNQSASPAQDLIIPGDIETQSDIRDLQRGLYSIRRDLKTWQEEQGIHVIYLSFGLLHWREKEKPEEDCLAPLLLVPIDMEREGSERPYTMSLADEDIVINPALVFKLETDFGLKMPLISEELDWSSFQQFIASLSNLIGPIGWSITDEVWLARFSFEKFVMYKDFDEHSSEAQLNPIVRALAASGSLQSPSVITELNDIDKNVDVKEIYPVLDADSSQMEVIIRARKGQNLVVYGPPGTGKSQTIVNLIAQSLRDGLKVLFVSEKMAALEVVHRRLKEIHLDFACLELHSHKSDKSRVIKEVASTLQEPRQIGSPEDASERFRKLIQRRQTLNDYTEELHKKRGRLEVSTYQAYEHGFVLSGVKDISFSLPSKNPYDVTPEDLDNWITSIRNISKESEVWNNYWQHPWHDTTINHVDYSISMRDGIISSITGLEKDVVNLRSFLKSLADSFDLAPPVSFDECQKTGAILEKLAEIVPVDPRWLQGNLSRLEGYLSLLRQAANESFLLGKALSEMPHYFKPNVSELPIEEVQGRFANQYTGFLRFINRHYKDDMRILSGYWAGGGKFNYRNVMTGLDSVSAIRRGYRWYYENHNVLVNAFGDLYAGHNSDWGAIEASINWTTSFIRLIPKAIVPERLIRSMVDIEHFRQDVRDRAFMLRSILSSSNLRLVELERALKAVRVGQNLIRIADLADVESWLAEKSDPMDLDKWADFTRARGACESLGLEGLIDSALRAKVESSSLEMTFLKRFWAAWLSNTYEGSNIIRDFRGKYHDVVVSDFRELDKDLISVTRNLISAEVERRQPKRTTSRTEDSQVGILLREAQKKKRHRSLRRLFTEASPLIQDLKPCFLMSPLSVATYLPKGTCRFDLVIFDEASQVRPEEAMGAFFRGRQVIVVGDNRQLPPTDFFEVDLESDYDEESEIDATSLESILDECAAVPSFYPVSLNWHYRSRYEELIAFSNREFYGGRLVTFPSPYVKRSSGAIQFIEVKDGVYDRGGSRTNLIEAKVVVDKLLEHMRNVGTAESIGVIALSMAQEEAIIEEMERRKSSDPDIEQLFAQLGKDEPLFVKALEKVQGDERDYIFISIGYGPDQGGIVRLNFGPINRAGGERRLNVAVTRARKRTTVISSLLPEQMDMSKLKQGDGGVVSLKRYLEYARNKGVFNDSATTEVPVGPFEMRIADSLKARGYQIDTAVGFSEPRLAVAVKDQTNPDKYLFGIESDGAGYIMLRNARDRNRLRQEVLERLGWNFARVWSTDWVRNQDIALESLVEKIDAVEKSKSLGQVRELPACTLIENNEAADKVRDASSTPLKSFSSMSVHGFYRPDFGFVPSEPKGEIASIVSRILEIEGPIHFDALVRRVLSIYAMNSRDSRKVRALLEALFNSHPTDLQFHLKDGFVALSRQQMESVKPRQMPENSESRPIDEICLEELSATAEWILREEYGMNSESLRRETARAMGCKRLSPDIENRIEEAISLALRSGRIQKNGDQLSVASKGNKRILL